MNAISTILKGFAMGVANVIPGVSGGTVAFVTGIYQRLLDAIKGCDVEAVRMLLKGRFKDSWQRMDGSFLFYLVVGVGVGVFTLAKFLEQGFEKYPEYVSALFFGLILASVWSVYRMVERWDNKAVIGLILGTAAAASLVFLPHAQENSGFLYLMICGVVAVCSLILPGVSGSFVLLLLGNYRLIMIDAVNSLRGGDFAESIKVLVPVALGAFVGLIFFARLLSWLFKKHHDVVVATIAGFVAGSLLTIWPWKKVVTETFGDKVKEVGYERYLPEINHEFWIAIAIMIGGGALMLLMEKVATRSEDDKI